MAIVVMQSILPSCRISGIPYFRLSVQSICIRSAVSRKKPLLVWSKNSCGFTFVVFEEASKPFATPNRAYLFCILADHRKEPDIALALMIPLVMIMLDILRQHMAERRF